MSDSSFRIAPSKSQKLINVQNARRHRSKTASRSSTKSKHKLEKVKRLHRTPSGREPKQKKKLTKEHLQSYDRDDLLDVMSTNHSDESLDGARSHDTDTDIDLTDTKFETDTKIETRRIHRSHDSQIDVHLTDTEFETKPSHSSTDVNLSQGTIEAEDDEQINGTDKNGTKETETTNKYYENAKRVLESGGKSKKPAFRLTSGKKGEYSGRSSAAGNRKRARPALQTSEASYPNSQEETSCRKCGMKIKAIVLEDAMNQYKKEKKDALMQNNKDKNDATTLDKKDKFDAMTQNKKEKNNTLTQDKKVKIDTMTQNKRGTSGAVAQEKQSKNDTMAMDTKVTTTANEKDKNVATAQVEKDKIDEVKLEKEDENNVMTQNDKNNNETITRDKNVAMTQTEKDKNIVTGLDKKDTFVLKLEKKDTLALDKRDDEKIPHEDNRGQDKTKTEKKNSRTKRSDSNTSKSTSNRKEEKTNESKKKKNSVQNDQLNPCKSYASITKLNLYKEVKSDEQEQGEVVRSSTYDETRHFNTSANLNEKENSTNLNEKEPCAKSNYKDTCTNPNVTESINLISNEQSTGIKHLCDKDESNEQNISHVSSTGVKQEQNISDASSMGIKYLFNNDSSNEQNISGVSSMGIKQEQNISDASSMGIKHLFSNDSSNEQNIISDVSSMGIKQEQNISDASSMGITRLFGTENSQQNTIEKSHTDMIKTEAHEIYGENVNMSRVYGNDLHFIVNDADKTEDQTGNSSDIMKGEDPTREDKTFGFSRENRFIQDLRQKIKELVSQFPIKIQSVTELLTKEKQKLAHIIQSTDSFESLFNCTQNTSCPSTLKTNTLKKSDHLERKLLTVDENLTEMIGKVKSHVQQLAQDIGALKLWLCMVLSNESICAHMRSKDVLEELMQEINGTEREASGMQDDLLAYYVKRNNVLSEIFKYPHLTNTEHILETINYKQYIDLQIMLSTIRTKYSILQNIILTNDTMKLFVWGI